MQAPRYEPVTVALYDPVAMNRNATRNVLYSLGFREIESFVALDDLKRAMTTRDFDLVVLEATKVDDPIYDFVARLRRSEISRNPFSVVLVGTWLPEAQVVRKVLDCGADDILSRPFSTAALGDRLRTHVHARKGFVVTSDYVGPNRRNDPTRPNSAKPITVVNSMKLKAVEGKTGFEAQIAIQAGVEAGKQSVNEERMRRAAFQIGIVAGFVHAQTAQANETVRRTDLERIHHLAEEMMSLAQSLNAEQAFKTAATVVEVAGNAIAGKDLANNAQLLVRLSVALQVTLTPHRGEAECHAELEETLQRIKLRGRKG